MNDLSIALGDYPHTRPLKDGRVGIDGFNPRFVEYPSILTAARSMCRNVDLDVTEMPLITYLVAHSARKPLIALPVFLVRVLPQFLMFANRELVPEIGALEGQRVGVRAYTVTAGVWGRIVLRTDHAVDSRTVRWIAADEEHVLEYKPPENTDLVKGASLGQMLDAGELAAVIGVDLDVASLDNVTTLFPSPAEAAHSWLSRGMPYPLNHTVAIRAELAERHPGLARALYEAFEEAKRISADDPPDRLIEGGGTRADEKVFAAQHLPAHPIQYGLEANRDALSVLFDHAVEQSLIDRRTRPNDVFASF